MLLRPTKFPCQHIGNFVENGIGYSKADLPRSGQSEKLIWIAARGRQSGDINVGIGCDTQHLAPARPLLGAYFLDPTGERIPTPLLQSRRVRQQPKAADPRGP